MKNYSAKLRHVVLVERARPTRRQLIQDSVVILRAPNRRAAVRRAVALGRASETEYANSRGERVRWVLAEVLSLDELPRVLVGSEVWSSLSHVRLPVAVSFRTRFRPHNSQPEASGAVGRLG